MTKRTDDIGSIHDDGRGDRFTRVKVLALENVFARTLECVLNVFSLCSGAAHNVSYSLDLPFLFCVVFQSLKLWPARPALCNTVHFFKKSHRSSNNTDLWIRPTDLSWPFLILVTICEMPFNSYRRGSQEAERLRKIETRIGF